MYTVPRIDHHRGLKWALDYYLIGLGLADAILEIDINPQSREIVAVLLLTTAAAFPAGSYPKVKILPLMLVTESCHFLNFSGEYPGLGRQGPKLDVSRGILK